MTADRSQSLDIARGLIVVLMALDHVRIYFTAAQFDPVDLDATTPAYFFTRWITHLCAPGFFFLAGLGAALFEAKADRRETSIFLLTRGLWLVALELLVFGFAWSFNPGWFWFGVIWALGAAMMVLGLLVRIDKRLLLAAAAVFAFSHDWLAPGLPMGGASVLLYSGGQLETGLFGPRLVLYPLLPWLALMVIGYASAPWLAPGDRLRWRRALAAGAALVALFLLARSTGFGAAPNAQFTSSGEVERDVLGFMNVEKYPPSLQFSAVTVGLLLLACAAAERATGWRRLLEPLAIFGRVPFFFYLVHLFVIHAAAVATAWLSGWRTEYLVWTRIGPNLVPPEGFGFNLLGVYAVWLAVVLALFPLCAAFARFKQSRSDWWLRYL